MIKISINVTKLDKARFVQGKNGTYCNLVLFENKQADQYGNDYSVKQDCTAEERQGGVQMPYVGNGKTIGGKPPARPQRQSSPPPQQKYQGSQKEYPEDDGTDIPY